MDNKRTPRETETRAAQSREVTWTPPSLLPDPEPQNGFRYRWIRTTLNGQPDPANVSYRFREGWVACKRSEHPELAHLSDPNSKNPDNIESGGLLLCKMPEEMADARERHFRKIANNQMESVDNNFLRESDPRMPVLKPERTTRVTFGRGSK